MPLGGFLILRASAATQGLFNMTLQRRPLGASRKKKDNAALPMSAGQLSVSLACAVSGDSSRITKHSMLILC